MGMNHKGRAHAILSASSSHRWLNCTPSARLEDKFQESQAPTVSPHAEEGTLAHEVAELTLRYRLEYIKESTYKRELRKLKKSQYFDEEMLGYVDTYVNIVLESYQAAEKDHGAAEIILEERIDFSHIVPEGFGTGDAAVISDKTLEAIDLKYGRGVMVEADNNPQLLLYASGLLRTFGLMYDIETIKVTIVQPRLDHYSTWEVSVDWLKGWEEVVHKTALKAYKGEGRQFPGTWCKFCKVKALCKAFCDQNTALAKHEFKEPYLIEEDQLLEIYKVLPMLQDWAKGVNEYMLKRALEGKAWEGLKVVSGTSRRKWTDEAEVIKKLKGAKFKPSQFQKTSLLGIPAIEKLTGADFAELVGQHVIKPQGAPTLVDQSDKRPGLGSEQAKIDFKD